jgi:hypothetical protein
MRYGKRHFYALGCRDKDRRRPRRWEARLSTVGTVWPEWAVVAYLAGYRGLMP